MTAKKHIAMVISRFYPIAGGTERQCAQLALALKAKGHRVVIITEAYEAGMAGVARVQGLPVVRLPATGPWRWVQFIFGSLRMIKRHRLAIVHAHMIALPAFVAMRAAKRGIAALIKTAGARDTGDFGTSKKTALGQFKLRQVRRSQVPIVCPSPELFREAGVELGGDYPLHVIPNGVDTILFHPAGPATKLARRQALGLDPQSLWAVYAGRFAKGKGVERVLRLFEKLGDSSRWRLLLVLAHPGLPPELASPIQDLGGRIHVAYNPSDTVPYYQAADLALLLSDGEGMSNFLLEAMASGVPILTTPAAAIGACGERDRWSWTVSASEPAAAEGSVILQSLERRSDLLAAKGTAARQEAEAHYSLESVATAYEALYDHLKGQP